MTTTGIYIRVSTAGQNEAGQRAEIERWLANHGIKDVRWFVDKKSGESLKRPAFEKLQAAIFAGEIKTVVVWKLDRLSRSLQDGINTLIDWCKAGVRVVSVTQQLDFAGVTGQLVASVLFAIAQMETETRRERQAAGIRVAKQAGKYTGRKPGSTKADPSRALALRAKGNTIDEISKALDVGRATVYRLLKL
ncbi:recombinase family protein [Anatilimnocola floriformis]|uniref:recombinase family protein n=1 Tax=Anatilimnocola floriformis TaxID=2948575 RepID=UPI0020C45074|nr:recombinase family protein [Anatilimnocola floriformis]